MLRNLIIHGALVVAVAISLQVFLSSQSTTDLHTTAAVAAFASRQPSSALAGKNVVITGVTSGIGEELAVTLLKLGANVFGLGRSEIKLQAFIEAHGDLAGTFTPVLCDLSDLDSVAGAADNILGHLKKSHPGAGSALSPVPAENNKGALHYLVNNAGIHYGSPIGLGQLNTTTKQGFDRCFTTNYLSHVLLTEKLLPALKATAAAASVVGGEGRAGGAGDVRVVQISSSYHWQVTGDALLPRPGEEGEEGGGDGRPHAADVGERADFFMRNTAYANSKLAQIWHANVLHSHHSAADDSSADGGGNNNNIKFVSVCPGWVGTNIVPEGLARTVVKALAFPPSQGISSALNALFRPEVKSGDFVGNSDLIGGLPLLRAVLTSEVASRTLPEVRKVLTDMFAGVLMICQK